VFGGPLANFLLSFVLFYGLLLNGEKVPEIKIGIVPTNTILHERGIRTGDVVFGIDGQEIISPTDLPMEDNKIVSVVDVIRGGVKTQVQVNMSSKDLFESMFKNPPILRKPILVNYSGKRFTIQPLNGGEQTPSTLEEYFDYKGQLKLIGEDPAEEVLVSIGENENFESKLLEMKFRPIDMMVKSINMSSPADKAGVKGGDIILRVNQQAMLSFEKMREIISSLNDEAVVVEIARNGEIQTVSVKPEVLQQDGKATKIIGVYSAVEYLELKFKNTPPKGIMEAIPLALSRTWETIVKTMDGFKKLITNEVSLRSIGGPIAIGKVANESFRMSLSYFFQLMALISVNLGIINLFPIPVLDGGHIMFIILEIINRGPVSRKKLEIAQQFGLSVLLILFAAALFNDFSRFF
jgi:regulator of sigma E protease